MIKGKAPRGFQPSEFRPPVEPVDEGVSRPKWSVLIPTHNCARYLEQTLRSVLDQDRGPDHMEIIVIDDFSTMDDPREVVSRLGKGRVKFVRQTRNVGKATNYRTGLNLSRGRLIHQLHGDDLVDDGFYAAIERAFELLPDAGACFCVSDYIDEHGQVTGSTGRERETIGLLDDWLVKLAISQRIQTPSIVVRRDAYERLGGFDSRLPNFEDWEMWVRIATCYPFGFVPAAKARYRVHGANTSTESVISGVRAGYLRKALAIMDSYLPGDTIKRCKKERARSCAHYLIRCIPRAVQARNTRAWFALCKETIRYSIHPRVLYYLFIFTVRYKRYLK